jgi:hypothetical protein
MAVPVQADSLTLGDTVTLKFLGVTPRQTVGIHIDSMFSGSVYAGTYTWTEQSPQQGYEWRTYCIDYQDVNAGDVVTFTVDELENAPMPGPVIGTAKADLLKKLWAWTGANEAAALVTPDGAAAMQLAVWEIVFENTGTYDVGNGQGDFYATSRSDLAATATSWLASAASYDGQAPIYALVSNDPNGYQDQAALLASRFATPVPFPPAAVAGFALMGAIGGVAGIKRRLRRQ